MSHQTYSLPAAAFLMMLLAPAGVLMAGDSVDYGAPYLTLEDGELVTKYPAAKHEGEAESAAIEVIDASPQEKSNAILVASLAAIALGALLLYLRQRRRSLLVKNGPRAQSNN